MDRETQEYYDNYFSLFSSAGWKQLMEEFSSNAFNINSVEATKDPDDMFFRKGQLNVLAHLINMESIVNTNYEGASEEKDD
jgi:ABC-type xylose transport system substrate-binding protein